MTTKIIEGGYFPLMFRFDYGGWEQMQQVEWTDGKLFYKRSVHSTNSEEIRMASPEQSWMEFWAVAEAARLWEWQAEYVDPLTLDGLQWSVEIARQGFSMVSEGSNAYPGWNKSPDYPDDCHFAHFVRAVKKLTGGRLDI